MKLRYMSIAVGVAAALAAAGLQAGNSCILEGSTERPCASACWGTAGSLDARASTFAEAAPLSAFESRVQSRRFGDALDIFRSDARFFSVIVR